MCVCVWMPVFVCVCRGGGGVGGGKVVGHIYLGQLTTWVHLWRNIYLTTLVFLWRNICLGKVTKWDHIGLSQSTTWEQLWLHFCLVQLQYVADICDVTSDSSKVCLQGVGLANNRLTNYKYLSSKSKKAKLNLKCPCGMWMHPLMHLTVVSVIKSNSYAFITDF